MKRRDLEQQLRELGWFVEREGGKHTIWAHAGKVHKLTVPRHNELNEHTARAILRAAQR